MLMRTVFEISDCIHINVMYLFNSFIKKFISVAASVVVVATNWMTNPARDFVCLMRFSYGNYDAKIFCTVCPSSYVSFFGNETALKRLN